MIKNRGRVADWYVVRSIDRENGLHAMRQGPGKHLKGRKLFGGAVEPEEFDYFHEMIINQELSRLQARGYADGECGVRL